jgi:hypothetical protein
MKKWMAIGLMAAASALAARADTGWGLFGAYWDGGDWGSVSGVGAKFSLELMPQAQLDLSVTRFNDFSRDEEGVDAEVTLLPIDLAFAVGYEVLPPLKLIGQAGASYYLADSDIDGADGDDVGDEVGWFVGGGLEVTIARDVADYGGSRIALMLDAIYRQVDAGRVGSLDLDLAGVTVNAGLMFRW